LETGTELEGGSSSGSESDDAKPEEEIREGVTAAARREARYAAAVERFRVVLGIRRF
jgi:hypothetical protein